MKRKERIVEFGYEGLRLWDIARWRIAKKVLNNEDFHGMKITDNPEEYIGKYIINDESYLY